VQFAMSAFKMPSVRRGGGGCDSADRETRSMSRLLLTNFKKVRGEIGYLRATVRVSNFCKALLFHDFGNRVARESLRRAFGKGSLSLAPRKVVPSGERKMDGVRALGAIVLALTVVVFVTD